MKKITSLLLFISFMAFSVAQAKTYSIKLTITSGVRKGWQWTNDEITLKSNKLTSKVMTEKEKFGSAKCASDTTYSILLSPFAGTMKNKGGSKITWNGNVSGETISGTAIWTNASGTLTYKYTGTLKK